MKLVSQSQLPPKEELLEEFKSGSIPRSETWQTLIHGLYLNNEQVSEIEEWYNTILGLSEQNLKIHAEIQVRHDKIEVWHGDIDLWQQQVTAEKDIAVNSAVLAKASEQAAHESENNAKASETKALDSAIKAASSEKKARASETEAKVSASKAINSENNAKSSETKASNSAKLASDSESKAKDSENAAINSENAANISEANAKDSENKATNQANRAKSEADRAENIANGLAKFVPGMVIMFSGTIDKIPEGWHLCDGDGETSNGIKIPDLMDRMVVCAGDNYDVGDIGGSETAKTDSNGSHSHSVTINSGGSHSHKITVNSHTLTVNQMPRHTHERRNGLHKDNAYNSDVTAYGVGSSVARTVDYQYTGKSQSHNHTASSNSTGSHKHSASSNSTGAHTHTVSTLSPYYALAFIIKL